MGEVWFDAVPEFVWSGGDCCRWAAIFEIDDCLREFHPKPLVKLELRDDCLYSFHNCSVRPFRDAVLVGAVWCSRLVNNAGAFELSFHPFSYSPPPSVLSL